MRLNIKKGDLFELNIEDGYGWKLDDKEGYIITREV